MAQFLSEIRLFAFPFAPQGWLKCNGVACGIRNNQKLFSLLGYRYGGSGDIFHIPDLRGRVLMDNAQDRPPFSRGGEEEHVLTIKEMPRHSHHAVASSLAGDVNDPLNHFWASDLGYVKNPNSLMHANTIGIAGGDIGHNNMAPYLPLNYCIAVEGDFPYHGYQDLGEFAGGIRPFCKPVEDGIWLKCDGRELPIAEFTELFAAIRNTYGGVENRTFRLPDLRGRSLVGTGTPPDLTHYKLGEKAGEAAVTLTKAQMPGHNHKALANATATSEQPNNCGWGNYSNKLPNSNSFASTKGNGAVMSAKAIGETGDDEAHNNIMPYQGMDYMICTRGEKSRL